MPPFEKDSSYVFTSKAQFQDVTMQGYLALQYHDPCNFRVSVNSTMGTTLLDLEWKEGECTEHFVLEKLDNKIILKALKSDFELLMLQTLQKGKWKNDSVKKVGWHKYTLQLTENKIQSVEDRNWIGRKKRSLQFDYSSDDTSLKSILLKHHNFAMQLQLTPIQ